ncbi:probable proline--tRNA ligase, mitochondrial [Trichogramma pretiosum]|uniref:probable proline--tRNA ligase, mitochondrial n=1 Tax=Trichogramma pretiosum TaxID=7493 RepID=UPI0006C948D7|nr:probable proline--tRNA ligase, mitochondrial [Trichogramma pretiosum]
MRWVNKVSQLFQPTVVIPKNAMPKSDVTSKSYQLMINAGIINGTSTGMYAFLPLGMRVLGKLQALVDEEMRRVGGQKVLLPILTPSKLWKKTNRLEQAQPELFQLKDRHGKEFLLSPTFEESITELVRQTGPLSHNQLPVRLYQISSKWRDEMKPRLGLFRSREFVMKDLYSFDADEATGSETYEQLGEAYRRVLERIGVPYVRVRADTGQMGGTTSHEYHYATEIGEDRVARCRDCGYDTEDIAARQVEGEAVACSRCNKSMEKLHSVEIGHTFLLGTRYSKPLNATYVDASNKKQLLYMGCYGLGLTRIIASAVEILSRDQELRWPRELAPYSVCIITPKQGSKEEPATHLAEMIYHHLESLGIDAIVDDRAHMTIGKRLVEARKSGYPRVVVVGKGSTSLDRPTLELHDLYDGKYVDLEMNDVVSELDKSRRTCRAS